jgi:hypothetical protein
MTNAYYLSESTVSDYQQWGAVVLRGVLSADEIDLLRQGIEHNLTHLSPLAQVASQPDDPGEFLDTGGPGTLAQYLAVRGGLARGNLVHAPYLS